MVLSTASTLLVQIFPKKLGRTKAKPESEYFQSYPNTKHGKKKFFTSSKFSVLDPFLHIDAAPVEHKSPVPHSEAKTEALQFFPEASDLQLFDLATAHVPPGSGSSTLKGIWRSLVGTPNAL